MAAAPQATRMFQEAADAANAVERQLAANAGAVTALAAELRTQHPRGVLTCARGSSDHAATFAKYLIETRLGVLTTSAAPSIASVYGTATDFSGMLAIGISQSGKSPDILAAMRSAREGGARTLALVNVEDSPLATESDVTLPLHAGPELSVAATKSYIASLAGLLHLVARWADDAVLLEAVLASPALLHAAWECDWSPLVERLHKARGLYVIGRGLGFGIAQEAALKFKETCGLHAEAYSSAEVKHGPMALVGPGFPVLCFAQPDETEAGMLALATEFRARGAEVWVSSAHGEQPLVKASHPACAPLLTIQSFYRAINALALRRGHNPDVPPHLNKVTETV
ncbi:MAG: SIS domain-containing protein [Sphingomonas sp.]